MLGFRPMSQGAVIYFHTIVINMNAQGLCAITKYYVNGGWKAPTHSPFLSPSLISHLPLYHVEAYQQCLSTLSSPGIQKYKKSVCPWQRKASWRLVQGEPGYLAGSTVVWAHVQRTEIPGTPGILGGSSETPGEAAQRPSCTHLMLSIVYWTPSIGKLGSHTDY